MAFFSVHAAARLEPRRTDVAELLSFTLTRSERCTIPEVRIEPQMQD
jgi:hypothetical protein